MNVTFRVRERGKLRTRRETSLNITAREQEWAVKNMPKSLGPRITGTNTREKIFTANNHNVEGNQAGAHNKGVQHEGATHGQHAMNHQQQMNAQHHQQQMAAQHHQQQMGALHHQQQMGGQHQQQKMAAQHHPQMQGGGNRPPPPPKGQPQGKKKPDKP